MYIGEIKVQRYLKKIRSIGVVWMVDIFSGGSGFGWDWVIWEFTFKGSISTISTGGCFC